jgi:hypothetical protein
MDIFEWTQWVIETQGLTGFMLLIVIYQNWSYTKRIITKNCEMEKFLMDCVKTHLGVECKSQKGT